jgi:hypothetical protein
MSKLGHHYYISKSGDEVSSAFYLKLQKFHENYIEKTVFETFIDIEGKEIGEISASDEYDFLDIEILNQKIRKGSPFAEVEHVSDNLPDAVLSFYNIETKSSLKGIYLCQILIDITQDFSGIYQFSRLINTDKSKVNKYWL